MLIICEGLAVHLLKLKILAHDFINGILSHYFEVFVKYLRVLILVITSKRHKLRTMLINELLLIGNYMYEEDFLIQIKDYLSRHLLVQSQK